MPAPNTYSLSARFKTDEASVINNGTIPTADTSYLLNSDYFAEFQKLLSQSTRAGKLYSTEITSTYGLVYTTTILSYVGGVLAPNGDIHFIPAIAPVGQKISAAGVVSTYSLAYTTSGAYRGGVIAPNGDIHFVPFAANRGQKISAAGVVSTYSLVYTVNNAYSGGVLAPNGDIHFVTESANRGQVIRNNSGLTLSQGACLHPWLNKF